ncbi:MAG: mono/diheme cytochrome c family protein [Planctomycetota bacterium]|jgi:mono/diheme cytochrome c family protein
MKSARPIRNACLGAGLFLCSLATPVLAQNGDSKGELQPKVDRNFDVPPAPILTPEQELATFQLPPGYKIELAASDPLVHDPVDISFDAQGRMWLVEMQGLMRDADGTGELDPVGTIATLSDKDGDGFFETRTVFADQLVLPRGICHGYGGVIAILPPELVWMKDTDGDGRFDKKVVIDQGNAFGAGLTNPEHAPNAPRIGLDNWLYLANHEWRYRLVEGEWQRSRVPRRGQWGHSQDDWGRWVYNYNSTPVHGDRVPTHYLLRNPALGQAQGSNGRLVHDAKLLPSRLNTGVNRGYKPSTLNDNGRLATYTAACAPLVFRGTALAPEDRGATVVCEPSGNLLRLNRMYEEDGLVSGEPVRHEFEFLTSTDERFRPVNLANGPDGALYVVDLYRGILQHRVFLTSFLRRQIEERGLDKGIGLGRIWRITYEESKAVDASPLDKLSPSALFTALSSPNAWRSETARRLLIEAGAEAVSAELPTLSDSGSTPESLLVQAFWSVDRALASLALSTPQTNSDNAPTAELNALWTLEGLGLLNDEAIAMALKTEAIPDLLAQWVRVSEGRAAQQHLAAWEGILTASPDRFGGKDTTRLYWQMAHSLGERPVAPMQTATELEPGNAPIDPISLAPLLLQGRDQDAILREGLLSGLPERELDLYTWLRPVQHKADGEPLPFAFRATCEKIGQLVAKRGSYDEYGRLFTLATPVHKTAKNAAGWEMPVDPGPNAFQAELALLKGFVAGLKSKSPGPFERSEPASLEGLLAIASGEHAELAFAIRDKLTFQQTGSAPLGASPSFLRGQQVYSVTCAACHQPDGKGLDGLAPPLGDSKWLGRKDEELIRIVVEGLSGEIEVEGKTWDLVMPPWPHLPDDQVADVLTYVLGQFGEPTDPPREVLAEEVKQVRNP